MEQAALFGALRRHPVWSEASDQTLRLLAQGATVVDRAPGTVFVVEGQPAQHLHLLVAGAVRIFYVARKGAPEVTVSLQHAPAAFGDIACALRTTYTASVVAVTSSRTIAIPATLYFAALQSDARACFRQYFDLARRFASAGEMQRAALTSTIVERVVALLLAYDDDGAPIALSQDDLAQQTGSNRRSIVRTIELLYDSGGLVRQGRKYVVTDRDKLRAAAQAPVPDMVARSVATPWPERP